MSQDAPEHQNSKRVRDHPILTALIGAVALIVAAIITVVFAHGGSGGGSPQLSSSSISSTSSAEAGSGSLPSTLSAGSIRWSGSVTIPNADGGSGFLNLDQLPPSDTAGYLGWSVGASACAGGTCVWAYGLDVSIWTGSGPPPDYSQCREWAQTHGLGDAYTPAQTGTELCLITAAGHTAFLQITGIDNSTDTASANVTIWTG